MYDNIKFKEIVKPFKKHTHGGLPPNFKLRSITPSWSEGPPREESADHVICTFCGKDLTFQSGKSKINLIENYIPA